MLRFQGKILGKASDHYATPRAFYDQLNRKYHFNMDPCPYKSTVDGLQLQWRGVVYVNPPYSNIYPWLKKGYDELCQIGRENPCHTVIYLLPVRTDTKYFHDFIMKRARAIYFIKGRLHFNDDKNPAPFPVMLMEMDFQSLQGVIPIRFESMVVEKVKSDRQLELF